MDDRELLAGLVSSLRAFYVLLSHSSPGARLIDEGGITAVVVPATPDRAVCNGVVCEDADALDAALDHLAGAYDDAGVRAWTVWIHESDTASAALLERSGHVLDASPAAMARELDGFSLPDAAGVEVRAGADIGDVTRLNDLAYGFDGDFERAFEHPPPGSVNPYVAYVGGLPAACVMAFDHEGDCCITLVATRPDARGRGLATALMGRALADGRERGCRLTTLEATRMGEPVYARLGYRTLGRLHMWERRKPA